ncbi:N-acetylmuramoyl-L-alanine amidase [Roseibium sp. RKSG952]|nr:N-acetylmuramoyl-L-alanine amidase [Roseibium sp. RKSG952]
MAPSPDRCGNRILIAFAGSERARLCLHAVILVLLTVILGAGGWKPAAHAASPKDIPSITGARVAGDEVRTRFVVDLDRHTPPVISALADPYRLIIDLPEVEFQLPEGTGQAGRGLITAWRYGMFAAGKSRIVLDLKEPVSLDKTFVLPAVGDQPARMVIDLVRSTHQSFLEFAQASREKRSKSAAAGVKGDRIDPDADRDRPLIVLDPGHGGIDPGAKGIGGTLEKAVVMDFSSLLKRKLEETGRYEVHLTRQADTFVSLSDRVRFGHDMAADLFISIHADSVKSLKEQARGASVYTLSDRASDDLAEELAERENMSDVIAGVQLDAEPTDVTDILLDLARRETRNFSVYFARTLVEELKSSVRLINNPHRSAGFRVLKAPDVPSVLVELGYLSNEHDEKLLISDVWRERMADAMVEAVDSFFRPQIVQDQTEAAARPIKN